MESSKLQCPVCGSAKIVKYGKTRLGQQRYCCRNRNCHNKIFQLDYRYEGCHQRIHELITGMDLAMKKRKERESVIAPGVLRIKAL